MAYRWAALAYGGDRVIRMCSCARLTPLVACAVLSVLCGLALAGNALLPRQAHAAAPRYTFSHTKTISAASKANDALLRPSALAADVAGNILYVLDSGNNRIVRYNLATGAYIGVITGGFNNPQGIIFQPGTAQTARLIVVDTGNNRLVMMSATGTIRDTLTSGLNVPTSAAWSTVTQRLYVLNAGAREVRVYQSTINNGNNQIKFVSSFTGSTSTGSVISTTASGLNVATDGTVLIADTANNRILHFSGTGAYIGKFGSASSAPAPGDGTLKAPQGVGSRADGYVPVVDTGNHRVQVFESASGGAVVAELGVAGQIGTSTDRLNAPRAALTVGTDIGIIADTGNNRVMYYSLVDAPDAVERTPINYDGLACTDCHSEDIRVEHDDRARGCASCHRTSLDTGKPDYSTIGIRIGADLDANGQTEMGSCGSNTRYCHSAEAKSPSGVSRAIHGTDGYQVQQAHGERNADGTTPATNSCTGTTGGCHSSFSTESPFWFGSTDPASAKADYYFHQARGTALTDYATGPGDTVGTVNLAAIDHPCMTCHDQTGGRSFGEREKAEAEANGEDWTCTTSGCHDQTGGAGVYSQAQCYRTPHWDKVVDSDEVDSSDEEMAAGAGAREVSPFYQPLIDLVLGEPEESAPVTVLADIQNLPSTMTPVSDPVPFDFYLAEHP